MVDNCLLCQIAEGKVDSKVLYEDDEILAVLDYNGAAPGHSYVFPKEHYPIFEQVPDHLVEKLFQVANKVSTALFDTMQVQGTNLFITNGISAGQSVAHFVINVIPRKEGDGINLEWEPRQLSEEEMSTVELKIKEGSGVPEAPKEAAQMAKPMTKGLSKENYLWKSVNRRIA